MKMQIEYLYDDMKPLNYAHDYDAGADVSMFKDVVIEHGKNIIPLGFKLIIPPGFQGNLCLRSSSMGNGCICNNVPFDADFSGEWNLIIYNCEDEFVVKKGERICQVVITPIIQAQFVTELSHRRGSNGVGSTGK